MISNLYFQISGVLILLYLLKVYFSKKRNKTIENEAFLMILGANVVLLIFDILSVQSVLYFSRGSLISLIISKLYLFLILVWVLLLSIYLHVISLKKKERIENKEENILDKLYIKNFVIFLVLLVLNFILPLDIINNGSVVYFSGYNMYFVFIITFVCILFCFNRYLTRHKFIKRNYSNLLLVISCIGFLTVFFQVLIPESLPFTFTIYFSTFIVYFTLDDKDLEVLEEFDGLKKQIEEIETSKTDILLKASHEIRTPLNTIIGFSDSILEGSSENIEEDVNYIKEAAKSLLEASNNILDISNINSQEKDLIYNEYSFDDLFKQIVALTKSKLSNKKVEFKYKSSANIPLTLYGDNIRLKQAITNIMYNAIKYTKEGYINLDISSISMGNICRLIINVKDTGVGISEDNFKNIFKEKYIDNKREKEEDKETSLLNTKNIIESMGGKIFIESEYGEGTSVKFSVDQKIVKEESKEEIQTDATKELNFFNKKILVVDDDAINLKVAERLLKIYKVQIDTVNSGLKCLEKINNEEKYDLIFMDDMMPNMSGTETLKQLQVRGFNTPVVALTANATYGMKEKYLKKGFDDYISKPIERKELDRVVLKYLEK